MSSGIAKASRIDRAIESLEGAVNRLDRALDKAAADAAAGAADAASSSDASEALDAARRENADLRALNRTAAERLASAIERLETLGAGPEAD